MEEFSILFTVKVITISLGVSVNPADSNSDCVSVIVSPTWNPDPIFVTLIWLIVDPNDFMNKSAPTPFILPFFVMVAVVDALVVLVGNVRFWFNIKLI